MNKNELEKQLIHQYTLVNDRVFTALTKRLKIFGTSNYKIYKNKTGRIVIEAGKDIDQLRLRKLVTASKGLGIYETYQNTETIKYLNKATKVLSGLFYPRL
ncbi:MAG TPA: hypothetical protein VD905_08815 [Flavobacteriales bacterium]|nr:hypothetical protein [Flavobacteriales bacterium]